jgi:hypothetical protein
MLRSNYEKSTDLINQFIFAEHKELNGGTIKYNKMNIFRYILYEFLNLINIKQNVKK